MAPAGAEHKATAAAEGYTAAAGYTAASILDLVTPREGAVGEAEVLVAAFPKGSNI